MRAVDVVVGEGEGHVLVDGGFGGVEDRVGGGEDVVAEVYEAEAVAFLFGDGGGGGGGLGVAIGQDYLLGLLDCDVLEMLAFFEEDELLWRHNGLLEDLYHLDYFRVVFEFGIEMRTVLMEHRHQLRLHRKILNQLLKRPNLQPMTIKMRGFLNPIRRIKLFINLLYFLFNLLRSLRNLHLLHNQLNLFHIQHLPPIRIRLQKQHHRLRLKRINLINLIKKHDALDYEILQALPDQQLLFEGVHSEGVAVQVDRLED